MARTAINMMLSQPPRAPQQALETRVSELESRIHLLSQEIKRLNQHHGHPVTNEVALPARTA
jgi:uncharacterized small protein (DUF1192 family)